MDKISGIRFTTTEIKILACFSKGACKTSMITRILNKNPRTIYSHLSNIKQKLEEISLDKVILFVEKSEDKSKLQDIFATQYQEYQFREKAVKAANAIKELDITCCVLNSKDIASNDVLDELLGFMDKLSIKIKKLKDDCSEEDKQGAQKTIFMIAKENIDADSIEIFFSGNATLNSPCIIVDGYSKIPFYRELAKQLLKKHRVIPEIKEACKLLEKETILNKPLIVSDVQLHNTNKNTLKIFKLFSVIIVGALIYALLMYNNSLQDKGIDKPIYPNPICFLITICPLEIQCLRVEKS
jgi:hypothetical protein